MVPRHSALNSNNCFFLLKVDGRNDETSKPEKVKEKVVKLCNFLKAMSHHSGKCGHISTRSSKRRLNLTVDLKVASDDPSNQTVQSCLLIRNKLVYFMNTTNNHFRKMNYSWNFFSESRYFVTANDLKAPDEKKIRKPQVCYLCQIRLGVNVIKLFFLCHQSTAN